MPGERRRAPFDRPIANRFRPIDGQNPRRDVLAIYGKTRRKRIPPKPLAAMPRALTPEHLVVLSYGGSAVDGLYRALEGKVPELVLVGDAMAPRLLHDAILEATRAARRI